MNVTTSKSNTHLSFYLNVILEFSNKAYVGTRPQNQCTKHSHSGLYQLVGTGHQPLHLVT